MIVSDYRHGALSLILAFQFIVAGDNWYFIQPDHPIAGTEPIREQNKTPAYTYTRSAVKDFAERYPAKEHLL